jgi:hypothetical protein
LRLGRCRRLKGALEPTCDGSMESPEYFGHGRKTTPNRGPPFRTAAPP